MSKDTKNYRAKFKRYYNIDFSSNYDIHHIDLNRENNEISNLMILPKKLHHQYHYYLEASRMSTDKQFERTINAKICGNMLSGSSYQITMMKGLISTLDECARWYDYKLFLDGVIPNFHGIILQG